MSELSQLKAQVNQIGEQAATLAGQIAQMAQNLEGNMAAVSQAIGGTSSGEDETMIASFQAANNALNDAATSLQAAGNAAKSWAAKV